MNHLHILVTTSWKEPKVTGQPPCLPEGKLEKKRQQRSIGCGIEAYTQTVKEEYLYIQT